MAYVAVMTACLSAVGSMMGWVGDDELERPAFNSRGCGKPRKPVSVVAISGWYLVLGVIATSSGEVAVYNKLNCAVLRKYFERMHSTWSHLTYGNNIDITTEYSACGNYAMFYIVQSRRIEGLVHTRKVMCTTRLILPRVYTTLT